MAGTIWKKLIVVSLAGIVISYVLLWTITAISGYGAYGRYGYNMNMPMNNMSMDMYGSMNMQGRMNMGGGMDMMKGMGMH